MGNGERVLDPMVVERAQGCLMGQLAGDALGSQVEFQSKKQILQRYPNGIRTITDGGTWNTLAGQPTDDSEMALALARTLVQQDRFDSGQVKKAYLRWFESKPFDCGNTVARGLSGRVNAQSQANGALMRISPLGIFGTRYELKDVAIFAQADARLTHPHILCLQANALFTMALCSAIAVKHQPEELFRKMKGWAESMGAVEDLHHIFTRVESEPPADYITDQGWVVTAFHNALWQLLTARNFEEACVHTVMQGGDTDTNAAICGALMGAVHGLEAIPLQWRNAVLNCRPSKLNPRVQHPRPEIYWPVDALELAVLLLGCKPSV